MVLVLSVDLDREDLYVKNVVDYYFCAAHYYNYTCIVITWVSGFH